jgi:hypothetical protein
VYQKKMPGAKGKCAIDNPKTDAVEFIPSILGNRRGSRRLTVSLSILSVHPKKAAENVTDSTFRFFSGFSKTPRYRAFFSG